MFNFFSNRKAKVYREICISLLDEADKKFSMLPSAKAEILPIVDDVLNQAPKSFWDEMTYGEIEKGAYAFIFNAASDIAASGKYHIGYGAVNPLSPMQTFRYLAYKCIDYAADHGELTEEQRDNQKRIFDYNVSHAG